MTAACLALLAKVNRPAWPFVDTSRARLVEAFPAAQLRQWKLPYQGYGKKLEGGANRRVIVESLSESVDLEPLEELMLQDADALDAVVCAFAAKALTTGALCDSPTPVSRVEGWIAVHR